MTTSSPPPSPTSSSLNSPTSEGGAALLLAASAKPLIAVVFTHNDAETLERCLTSVASRVEAIWIIDTGSTDNTLTIARRYTQQVYSASAGDPWRLWQETLTALRHDYPDDAWLLWLEPTDWLPTESQQQLERWHRLESSTAPGGFLLKQVLHHWDGQPLSWGNLTHHDCRLALLSAIRSDDHPVFCGWALELTTALPSIVIYHQPYGSFGELLQGALHWQKQQALHKSV